MLTSFSSSVQLSTEMVRFHYTSQLAPLYLHCHFELFFCKNCAYCWLSLLRYPLLQYDPLLALLSTSFEYAEFLKCLFEYSINSETNLWGQDLMSAITQMNWRNKQVVLTDWRDYTSRYHIATCLSELSHSQASGHIKLPWNCCAVNFHLFVSS
jgi:hypothetical protein